MIKTTSFYLFQNFRRVTQEFYDDNSIVKDKSLTNEREFDFDYKDVGELSETIYVSRSQSSFSFWAICISAFTLSAFCNFIYAHPFLLLLEQAIYIGGIILLAASFKNRHELQIYDRNDRLLTTIKQSQQNRDLIPKILELIKSKSKDAQELNLSKPFPVEPAAFELMSYHILDFAKVTERFYSDKLIGVVKSMFGETIYQIKYSHFNGKTTRGKNRGDFGWVAAMFMLGSALFTGFLFGFAIRYDLHLPTRVSYINFVFLALFLFSSLFGLIKHEDISMLSKNGGILYSIPVRHKNKDKIKEIVTFIQSKVNTTEDQTPLKEQA